MEQFNLCHCVSLLKHPHRDCDTCRDRDHLLLQYYIRVNLEIELNSCMSVNLFIYLWTEIR